MERRAVPYLPIRDGLYSRRLNLVPLISDRIRRPPNPQDAVKILSRWGRICNRFVPIIAPESIVNSELKSKALAEVTKNLRDAMGTEDDDDTSGGAHFGHLLPSLRLRTTDARCADRT